MQLVPFVVLFDFQNDYYQYFQSEEILSTKVPAYWLSKDNSNRGSKSITLTERIPMVSIIQKNSCNIMRLWDYWISSISCSHRFMHYVVLWWLFFIWLCWHCNSDFLRCSLKLQLLEQSVLIQDSLCYQCKSIHHNALAFPLTEVVIWFRDGYYPVFTQSHHIYTKGILIIFCVL